MNELEEYQDQLKEVEDSLKLDPENESLKELQKELMDLVQLLLQNDIKKEQTQIQQEKTSIKFDQLTSSTTNSNLNIGDVVFVKSKLEKIYKEAKITSIAGSGKTYTVKFLDSQIIETYPVEELFTTSPKQKLISKYKQQQLAKEQKKEEKKLKNQEYEQSLNKSAQSWKSFSTKKKVKKTMESSQFKTNSIVNSKVGVFNSGSSITVGKKKAKNVGYSPY